MGKTTFLALALMTCSAAVLGSACGDDGGTSGSSPGSTACDGVSCDGVKKFGELNWSTCTGCHSSDPAIREQNGVPADSDYTTYDGAAKRAELVAERVADGTMPQGSSLSDGDKQDFIRWGCCDAPQ
jgi:hypothetical protein